ncbi:hypothetical protein LOD99_10596 [Oopsacas minuta]|uniref:Uncharacterized protein n=1 Tax=Oopsacas minuta TaxID=111878 RepID=A0AAV7KET0_9METZ|nr:hypothetical protein LOD99_10596 [Oopsacas minuta]
MKAITVQQLWLPSFQNHLKNLKVKALITNFILLILVLEIGSRVCFIYQNHCEILELLKITCSDDTRISSSMYVIKMISQFCLLPVICLFTKVLWLVYLHTPYKYNIMKWTAYMVMKIIAYLTFIHVGPIINKMNYGYIEDSNIEVLNYIVQSFFLSFELSMYIIYSRQFYLLLKGRELGNQLFLDKHKYLESKYLCIHYKVSAILITIAFLSRMLAGIALIQPPLVIYLFKLFPQIHFSPELKSFVEKNYLQEIFMLIYRITFNLNYLYLMLAIILQYWKKRRNISNINDRIRPLLRDYQDKIYYPRFNYRFR